MYNDTTATIQSEEVKESTQTDKRRWEKREGTQGMKGRQCDRRASLLRLKELEDEKRTERERDRQRERERERERAFEESKGIKKAREALTVVLCHPFL